MVLAGGNAIAIRINGKARTISGSERESNEGAEEWLVA